MDEFLDKIINDRIEEGRAEIIRNLIASQAGSIEQIAAWVKLPVEEVKKIASKVPVEA